MKNDTIRVKQLRALLHCFRHHIRELDRASKAAEYTDTDAVWQLLHWMRDECSRQLRRDDGQAARNGTDRQSAPAGAN